jgi:hypothetical protein
VHADKPVDVLLYVPAGHEIQAALLWCKDAVEESAMYFPVPHDLKEWSSVGAMEVKGVDNWG